MERVLGACEALLEAVRGHLWVGFSGGMDSTVLLHALAGCARDGGSGDLARITAVHVNHSLAPASGTWALHCERTAAELGVAFHTATLSLTSGANLEARARSARYRVFRSLLAPGDVLVLAHHENDQMESVLLHLFQGRGLYGMPAERALGEGELVRPFLALPREALAAYARAHDLEWIEDPTNRDVRLDRNFLRHQVVPALCERFAGLPQRLSRLTVNATATAGALEEALGLDRNPLPLAVLDGLSRPVRSSVLRHWLIAQNAAAGVSDGALADFLLQLESAHDRQPSMNLAHGRLARYRRKLYLVVDPPPLDERYPIACPGQLDLAHGRLRLDPASDGTEGQQVRVAEPLYVTFVGALPAGSTLRVDGQNRKVRELMRLAGVPPWEREALPLLADQAGIAALPGVATRDPEEAGARSDTGDAPGPPRTVRVTWEAAAGDAAGRSAR